MKLRVVLPVQFVALALVAAGCGDGGATTSGSKEVVPDPKLYFGSFVGNRVDLDDPAMAESTSELIGESVLTLDDGDLTYTMTHEGILFGGNYEFGSGKNEDGESVGIMTLKVTEVVGFDDVSTEDIGDSIDYAANKAAGQEPTSPERYALFLDIVNGIDWTFEVLDSGFRHIDWDGRSGMYVFRRRPLVGFGAPE